MTFNIYFFFFSLYWSIRKRSLVIKIR